MERERESKRYRKRKRESKGYRERVKERKKERERERKGERMEREGKVFRGMREKRMRLRNACEKKIDVRRLMTIILYCSTKQELKGVSSIRRREERRKTDGEQDGYDQLLVFQHQHLVLRSDRTLVSFIPNEYNNLSSVIKILIRWITTRNVIVS